MEGNCHGHTSGVPGAQAGHKRVPAHRHGHLSTAAVAVPVVLGVVYGLYSAFILSSGHGLSTAQLVLSVVSGVVLAALCFGFGRIQHVLPGSSARRGTGCSSAARWASSTR